MSSIQDEEVAFSHIVAGVELCLENEFDYLKEGKKRASRREIGQIETAMAKVYDSAPRNIADKEWIKKCYGIAAEVVDEWLKIAIEFGRAMSFREVALGVDMNPGLGAKVFAGRLVKIMRKHHLPDRAVIPALEKAKERLLAPHGWSGTVQVEPGLYLVMRIVRSAGKSELFLVRT